MIYTVRGSAFIFIFLFFFAPIASAAKRPDAKALYDQAMRQEQQLLASKQLSSRVDNWKKVVTAFQKIYYTYPTSGYCDNALFHVASLYARMAEKFRDPLYHRRACSSYLFLIEQYSSSSLLEEAKLEYIRIMRDELGKEREAVAMEARLKSPPRVEQNAQSLPVESAPVVTAQSAASSHSGPGPAVMKNLRHYTGADYSRIVIDFDREVTFKRNRLDNPDRLYFDFEDTVTTRALLKTRLEVDDGFLKQVRVGQNTESRARVVLDLKSIESYEVFPLYHPYRIVIDIQGKKGAVLPPLTAEVQDEPPQMAEANKSGHYSLARQLGLKVQRIMIDPGHGGHDPGAMSGKLREKDITLDVSRRLKTLLEDEYGFEVLMTRENDVYVPLEERIASANSSGVDLFVSVHVNSSRNPRAKGIETYYLNFASTPEAMEVAARENAIAEKNMAELQKLTTAIAMNSKIAESREFATLIQGKLVDHLQKDYTANNLGVKQAPFYVLIGAQMPAVLAEISFLSNRHENSLLSKSLYRQSIAQGLANGVKGYIDTLAASKITQRRAR